MPSIVLELIGRALLICVTWISALFQWWLPLIVAPVFWQLWGIVSGWRDDPRFTLGADFARLAADILTHTLYLAFFAYAIIAPGRHIGGWYAWVGGFLYAFVIAQFLGLLWPRRWNREYIEGRM